MKKIYILTILMLMAVMAHAAKAKTFTLVIDAGHGGHDAGACGAISKEKNLTLKFALAFGQLVEKNCPDVRVIYTRKTDRFVELYRRAEIANKDKADLFISIHINALPGKRIARGFQTYTLGTSKRTGKRTGVLENLEVAKRENSVILIEKDYKQRYQGFDPNSPESNIMFEFIQDKNMENSVELAKYMQRYVCQATGRADMGAHQDNLAVLRLTSMPACLIELGFISTSDEEQYMNTSTATDQYARGIYNAFIAYKKRHGGKASEVKEAKEVKDVKEAVMQEEPAARPKGKMARELADVRESRLTDTVEEPVKVDNNAQAKMEEPEPADEVLKADSVAVVPESKAKSQESKAKSQQPKTKIQEPSGSPVFKLQILATATKLKPTDPQLKGQKQADCYQEGGLYKYTLGSSEDYNEISQLRKAQLTNFPQAFIIAFKDGQKMNVQEAIREYKSKKVKK